MRKRVQEGDVQKQTNLKILMHLSQKIHLTTFNLHTDFLLLCILKKKTTLLLLVI